MPNRTIERWYSRSVFRACILLVVAACQSTAQIDRTGEDKAPPPTKAAEQPAEPAPSGGALRRISFDDAEPGGVPAGFTPGETNSTGTPAKWGVVADPRAPSGPNVFGVLETKNTGQTYNVALLDGDPVADVDIAVMVKAVTGEKDQGGGVVFRARGPGDYYIARWNPVEKNVKFYVVRSQHREELAKADLDIDPTAWHALRVLVEGDRFELFVDEASALELRDTSLADAGAVGLWTKADAATRFDDLVITPLQ
jgi:hypothetical protein